MSGVLELTVEASVYKHRRKQKVLVIAYSGESDLCGYALMPIKALDGYDLNAIDFKRNPNYSQSDGLVEELFERLGIRDRFPRHGLPEPNHDLAKYMTPNPSFRVDKVVSIGFWY
jgi:hypothetical protein